MSLGELIRRHREAAGLTTRELAIRVGRASHELGQYEIGAKVPHADTLGRIAGAVGVDPKVFGRPPVPRPESPPFGRLLKAERERDDISRAVLESASGIVRGLIARMERGSHSPNWAAVQAIAKALGVPVTAFAEEPTATAEGKPKRTKGKK